MKCQGCVTLHVFDKSRAIRTKNLFFVLNFALNLGIFSILNVFARSGEIPPHVTQFVYLFLVSSLSLIQ